MDNQERRLYRAAYHTDKDNDTDDSNTSDTSPTGASDTEDQNLSPEEKTWKKRYADLRSFSNNLNDRVKELELQLRAASNKEVKLPSTKQEIEAFAHQYPDVFRHFRSIVLTELMQEREHIANETQIVKEDLEKVKRERGVQKILNAHPDFEQINMSEEFHEWARLQPQKIQDWLFEDNDPDLCIRGLDLYKADLGIKKVTSKPERKPRADVQVNPRSSVELPNERGDKHIWKASEIQKMHPKLYEQYEKEIDLARSEGRIDFSA